MAEIMTYLTDLYGEKPAGLIWIGGTADGFKGRTFTTSADASRYAEQLDTRGGKGVYHRGTLMQPVSEGRGKADDATSVHYFALDGDLADAGHKASNLPDSFADLIDLIDEAGFPEPTQWVASGGGFYPQWVFPEPVDVRDDRRRAEIKGAFIRLEQHFQAVWERHGWKLDSVRDIARIWRVPGTTNRKLDEDRDATLIGGAGERYTLDALLALTPGPAPAPAQLPMPAADAFDVDAEDLGRAEQGVWTTKEAKAEIDRLLKRLRSTRVGEGLNNTLNATTLRVFRFVPHFIEEGAALEGIRDALAATGCPIGAKELGTIESARGAVAASTERAPFTRAEGDAGRALKKLKKLTGSLKKDQFTDAAFADIVAVDVLRDRFVHTAGVGWMAWSGKLWERCEEGTVVNAVRIWVLERYAASAKANRDDETSWLAVQSKTKLANVVQLAKDVHGVARRATDFDTAHDVLNAQNCVVDLRTGKTKPHAPGYLMTKITSVNYVPGAEHADFKTALGAIPEGVESWLQLRLGQSATGYATDDDKMVLLTGGGGNGKTVLLDVLFKSLGSYGTAVPSELLLTTKSKGGPTPEKMTLKGTRLAYIEETPEGRHLDVTATKQVVGTPTMQGRYMYKDIIEFESTHCLWVVTNYPPFVAETDDGTWRRLLRVVFPYRYRWEGDGAGAWLPNDRPGDPTLKAKLREDSAREAALAWLVEGAKAWYTAGRTLRGTVAPEPVVTATHEWRKESDDILCWLEAYLTFQPGAWVPTTELYGSFAAWSAERGGKTMSERTFSARFRSNSLIAGKASIRQVYTATEPGRSHQFVGTERKVPARTMAVLGVAWQG